MILGRVALIRRRLTAGHRDAATGRWVDGEAADTPFTGSIQPVGRKDREALPEGLRTTVERMVYTDPGTLRTVNQLTGEEADQVIHDGIVYDVVHVDTWVQLLSHDHAFLVRAPEAEEAA